jgi:hypothetical protein
MAKKTFKITRIRRLRLHVWRGRLKRKAVKYDAEDRVQEDKSGLWTYKRLQGQSYSLLVVFKLIHQRNMTVILLSGTSAWRGRLKVMLLNTGRIGISEGTTAK